MKQQPGFTLIELVIVIVILALLAIVIIPKYINLKTDASQATVQAIAGDLAAASTINYTIRSQNPSKGTTITNCQHMTQTIQGGLPNGYSINYQQITPPDAVSCTLSGKNGQTAQFVTIGIA